MSDCRQSESERAAAGVRPGAAVRDDALQALRTFDHYPRLRRLVALNRTSPEVYAAQRLGSLADGSWARARVLERIERGDDPFDAIDDVSHAALAHLFDRALERTGPAGSILDWGSGNGSLANFHRDYTSLPNPVVAVDATPPTVPLPSHVTFRQSDLHDFHWDGPPFDMGLCLHVFEHVPEPEALARRFRSLLREGAMALFAVPDGRWAHDLLQHVWGGPDCDHVNSFTLASFDALLVEAGFERDQWTCWPAHFAIHYGEVELPDGRSLGEVLDGLARHFDRANGVPSFSCYGYALTYVAR